MLVFCGSTMSACILRFVHFPPPLQLPVPGVFRSTFWWFVRMQVSEVSKDTIYRDPRVPPLSLNRDRIPPIAPEVAKRFENRSPLRAGPI